MKYRKVSQLLAIGILISPLVLAAQPAAAEEAAQVDATQNSNPETTASAEENIEVEPVEQNYVIYNSQTGAAVSNYLDLGEGNGVQFDKVDVKAGETVNYTATIAEGFELKAVSFVNKETGAPIAVTAGSTQNAGSFVMPEGNVNLTVTIEKLPVVTPPGSESGSESGSSTETETGSSTETESSTESEKQPETGSSSENPSTPETGTTEKPETPTENNSSEATPSTPENPTAPAGTATDSKTPTDKEVPTIGNDVQDAIVREAYQHIGKPYVWGAKGPNAFDCSGLTYYVYLKTTGHYIGGWTGEQQFAGAQIPVSAAQPGDLLFWGPATGVTHHVAIYVGNGMMIHAPQPGDVVKLIPVASFMPNFAVRVNVAGLPKTDASLENAFGEYNVGDDPFTFSKNQSTDEFLGKLAKDARKIGQEEGIYASVMLAQAILESGSGNSALASAPNFNLFGIKGKFAGESVSFNTLEQDEDGKNYQIKAEFRKYPSYKESMEDYAGLIKKGISGNKEIYKGAWKSETKSYKDATKHLQGRYATDKQYAEKLNAIIEAYDLTQYDDAEKTTVTATSNFGPKRDAFKEPLILTKMISEELGKVDAKEIFGPLPFKGIKRTYYVDLFRGDSLITLASIHSSKKVQKKTLVAKSNPVFKLKGQLALILPPIKK